VPLLATGDPSPPDGSPLPLVSIVTPSLDQGRFIEATIRSVLEQDYPRIEYVVVDGGSIDGTVDLLERYAERVRWISEPDAGQAAAINKGFRSTSGTILGWLNSDDLYEPGAVAAAVARLRARPEVPLVYGDAVHVDEAGRVLGPCPEVRPFDRRRLVHEIDFVVQPAAFFRRDAFEAAGGLDESLHWTMDYDLWLRLTEGHDAAYLPRPLAAYRLTGDNKTLRGGFARLAEIERVGRRHGAGGLPAAFRVEKLGLCRREARAVARRGHLLQALGLLGRGAAAVLASPHALGYALATLVSRRRRPGPGAGSTGGAGRGPRGPT